MWFVLLKGKAVVTTYDPRNESVDDHASMLSAVEGQVHVQSISEEMDEQDTLTSEGAEIGHHMHGPRQNVTIEVGSSSQFLLALDLLGRGHWTDYPSDEETWALQIPLAEGWDEEIGRWDVVGEGACT